MPKAQKAPLGAKTGEILRRRVVRTTHRSISDKEAASTAKVVLADGFLTDPSFVPGETVRSRAMTRAGRDFQARIELVNDAIDALESAVRFETRFVDREQARIDLAVARIADEIDEGLIEAVDSHSQVEVNNFVLPEELTPERLLPTDPKSGGALLPEDRSAVFRKTGATLALDGMVEVPIQSATVDYEEQHL